LLAFGTLKYQRVPHVKSEGAAFLFDKLSRSGPGAVAIAAAVGVAYFLADRLGVVLRALPSVH